MNNNMNNLKKNNTLNVKSSQRDNVQDNSKIRKILHVDLDAFFASVEELDHPEYKTIPMAVGGRSQRGIITTCNYIARSYGIHSAMPVFQAKTKCPELLIVPTRHERYSEKSLEVFTILRSYTRFLEKVSIDEAYLDITSRPESAFFIAKSIQDEVEEITGLSISVGISYNKFLAKIASDWKKPHGIFEIKPGDAQSLLNPLPVSRVHGIGKKSVAKLNTLGIHTVHDLKEMNPKAFMKFFGKNGTFVYNAIRGKDLREVTPYHDRKSIGIERTFSKDIYDKQELKQILYKFSKELHEELVAKNLTARTFHLKIKTKDFVTMTRSHTLENYTNDSEKIYEITSKLLLDTNLSTSARLLGISASNLSSNQNEQLTFF